MPDHEARDRTLSEVREAPSKLTMAIKYERIAKWKERVKKSAVGSGKLALRWLRGDTATQCGVLRKENGELNGHPEEIMDILRDK